MEIITKTESEKMRNNQQIENIDTEFKKAVKLLPYTLRLK